MKTLLVLSIVLCAAFAAPAEDKEMALAVEAPEPMAPSPELEENMMKEEEVMPEDFVPEFAPVSEEAEEEARFNICPDGWFHHGSRCYIFINSALNWYSAKDHCNGLGANLASVSNPREYTFLQGITKTAGQSAAWLGGFRLQSRWLWIDQEGYYYTNWYSQSSTSTYVCMYLNSNLGWSNYPCTGAFRFICSKNAFGC